MGHNVTAPDFSKENFQHQLNQLYRDLDRYQKKSKGKYGRRTLGPSSKTSCRAVNISSTSSSSDREIKLSMSELYLAFVNATVLPFYLTSFLNFEGKDPDGDRETARFQLRAIFRYAAFEERSGILSDNGIFQNFAVALALSVRKQTVHIDAKPATWVLMRTSVDVTLASDVTADTWKVVPAIDGPQLHITARPDYAVRYGYGYGFGHWGWGVDHLPIKLVAVVIDKPSHTGEKTDTKREAEAEAEAEAETADTEYRISKCLGHLAAVYRRQQENGSGRCGVGWSQMERFTIPLWSETHGRLDRLSTLTILE
ncbi:hypothetical protein BDW74DRAFT_173661 [Aspergillus multicolor]|uniref:uncharacterized protein n=1 Tax=Aspergillus multicolor TaxID=41759 RepID=UPI003CCE45DC